MIEPILKSTQSICTHCKKIVPAELFVRSRALATGTDPMPRATEDVWMRKLCVQCGPREDLYFHDAALFREMDQVVGDYTFCRTFECLKGVPCDRCLDKSYNIMIEVTTRCNLDCPVCCSDANTIYSKEPSIDQMIDRLPEPRRGPFGKLRRPNIVLFGGEPTVRKDLPELIRRLVAKGFIPRVATNGVRMTNDAYLKTLREAGLKWVILQFDGFSDDVSELVRGERLQARKMEAIEKMIAHGFKVQLGTMMVQGVNTRYAHDIIDFVIKHPRIFWMSFYPHASQARALLGTHETPTAMMLQEIERHTRGRITPQDFVDTMKMLKAANVALGTPNLRQKISTLPMMLYTDGTEYWPLVRVLQRPSWKHRSLVPRILKELPKILYYQSEYTPPWLKILVVEKFHNDQTIDLEEASNCHMAFMTQDHYVPFDIYNSAYKQGGAWDTPGPKKGKSSKLRWKEPIRASYERIRQEVTAR